MFPEEFYAQLGERQLPTLELLGSGKLFPPSPYAQKVMPKYVGGQAAFTLQFLFTRRENKTEGAWLP